RAALQRQAGRPRRLLSLRLFRRRELHRGGESAVLRVVGDHLSRIRAPAPSQRRARRAALAQRGACRVLQHLRAEERGRQADIGHPIVRHVQLLRERFLPVAQLLAVDETSALYNEGERRSIFYAEAWALTHYLLMERPSG